MMHKVDVKGVAILGLICLHAVDPVIVGLDLKIRPALQLPLPARQKVAAGEYRILLHSHYGWRGEACYLYVFAGYPVVDIALNGQRIGGVNLPVGPKTTLGPAPVVKLLVIGMIFGACVDTLSVDPVTEAVVVSWCTAAALPEIQKALVHRAAAGRDKSPF